METNQGTTGNASPMFAAFNTEKLISFIRAYDPKAQVAEGYRHAVIRYRDTGKQGVVVKPAQMVTIPCIKLDTDNYLMPEQAQRVLVGILEDAQDDFIKSQIEDKVSLISWPELSVDAMLAQLTAVRVSQRLTKEQIENWVNVAMLNHLETRGSQNAEAKGYADGSPNCLKQIAGTVNKYRDCYGKLAAPVPNLGQEEATALSKMLEATKLDDDIAKTLRKKLHAILNPVAANNGDL